QHGLKRYLHILVIGNFMIIIFLRDHLIAAWERKITVYAKPTHLMDAAHFSFSHNGDIIFCLAGDGTGTTTNAGIKVNGHSPFDRREVLLRIKSLIPELL